MVDLYIKVIGTKEILNSVITKSTAKETLYPHVEENIEFKNFNYSFGDNHVIKNFNFNINKGGKYAVIGKSGSGKSTILRLLLRYYPIQTGDIRIKWYLFRQILI